MLIWLRVAKKNLCPLMQTISVPITPTVWPSYVKGSVFLAQLGYIIGNDNLDKTMKRYYDTWKFKHPNDNDFRRIAEKVSSIHLGWYLDYWKNTTHFIDYALDTVVPEGGSTLVTMKRIGKMPMPVDVLVTYKDGSKKSGIMLLWV